MPNLLASLLFSLSIANAQNDDVSVEGRISQLEEQVADLKVELEEERRSSRASDSIKLPEFLNRISLNGLLEVEAFYVDAEDDEQSDIVLATVELGVAAEIHKHVSANIVLLFEEDDTEPMDIDTGTVAIGNFKNIPLTFTAGTFYPAFGNYNSYFVSDPPTLELGELRESAVQLELGLDLVTASVTVFNGSVDEIGDSDHADSVVLAASVMPVEQLQLGLSYITNIADSNGLEGEFGEGITDKVAGISAFAVAAIEQGEASVEFMTATDSFKDADLDFDEDGSGDQPWALNVEAAVNITEELQAAARYAATDEFLDFPEKSYGAAASYTIFENASIALELLRNEYAHDTEDITVTGQLAAAF